MTDEAYQTADLRTFFYLGFRWLVLSPRRLLLSESAQETVYFADAKFDMSAITDAIYAEHSICRWRDESYRRRFLLSDGLLGVGPANNCIVKKYRRGNVKGTR